MTFRVDIAHEGPRVAFRLAGRIQGENLGALDEQMTLRGRLVVLDLVEVTLVDLQVVRFLSDVEAAGIELRHCPPFIREWIDRERDVDR